jgi:hypothetical protein
MQELPPDSWVPMLSGFSQRVESLTGVWVPIGLWLPLAAIACLVIVICVLIAIKSARKREGQVA